MFEYTQLQMYEMFNKLNHRKRKRVYMRFANLPLGGKVDEYVA